MEEGAAKRFPRGCAAHVDRVQDRLLALKYEYAAKGAATNS